MTTRYSLPILTNYINSEIEMHPPLFLLFIFIMVSAISTGYFTVILLRLVTLLGT